MSKPSITGITGYLLDSSVVRPMLLGTRTYQQYFAAQFQDQPCYVSPFIRMEMYRSYLRNIIEFYSTLDLPGIHSFSDALTFWPRSSHLPTRFSVWDRDDRLYARWNVSR